MEFQPINASDLTIDVTDTTKEVKEFDDIEQYQVEQPKDDRIRNIFYGQDAFTPLPKDASPEDREFHRKLKKSIKRLRRFERSPLFEVQRMAILQEEKMMEENEDA